MANMKDHNMAILMKPTVRSMLSPSMEADGQHELPQMAIMALPFAEDSAQDYWSGGFFQSSPISIISRSKFLG
jgi:hypothetical protein